jgi:hypothetical protein
MPKDQLVIDPQETPITYSSIAHSQKGYTNGLFVLLYELVLVLHEKDAENSLDVMKGVEFWPTRLLYGRLYL